MNQNNQQNQNVRQITPEEIAQAEGLPKPLTAEELQKTQVLNFKELQSTIKFEKLTSKKPAIIIAVIGIFLLLFGTTFQIATSLNDKNKRVEKRVVEKEPAIVETSLSCVKTTLNNPDSTDTTYNIDFYFENDKLTSEIREYKYTTTANNPTGEATIKSNLDKYQKLSSSTKGYQVSTNSKNAQELTVIVQVDYKNLDLTVIPENNQQNNLTKVEYQKNINSNKVKNKMINEGFTCE